MTYRIIILLFLSQVAFSQIPHDFEFLYHDNQNSSLGAKHLTDDGLLFVAHNGAGDMSVVAFAKNDNTQEILFTSNFSSQSKKVITQDSAIHFLLYSLFDYDVGIPGFYDVIYQNGEVEVRSFSWKDNSVIQNEYVNHVSIDTQGNYVIEGTDKNFITFYGDSILNEVELDFYLSGVYTSNDYKVYVRSSDKIFLFDNNQLFEVLATEDIKDIQTLGSYNAVLLSGQIDLYDDSFNLINTFVINPEIRELKQVSFVDSTIYTIVKDNDELTISTIEWNGNVNEDIIQAKGNETIKDINYLSPNNYLIQGYSVIQPFQGFPSLRNLFFRSVDVINGNSYERTDIQILDYELIQTGKDSFANYIDFANNDTTWWVSYLYDIDCNLLNNSDDEVYAVSVFHSPLFNNFGPTSLKLYDLDNVLGSKDQVELSFSGESFGTFEILKNLELIIPGANQRFNIAENVVTLPDFKSDINTLELNTTLEVFPNPANGYLNISSDKPINSIAIYNIQGQLVLALSNKSDIRKVDIDSLDDGQYYLKTEDSVSKFIKQSF